MFSVISLLAILNKRSQHLNKIRECDAEEDTSNVIVHNEIVLKKEEKIMEQSCQNQNEKLFVSQESKNTSLKFDYQDSNDSFAQECKFSLKNENRQKENKKNAKVNNPRKIVLFTELDKYYILLTILS